MTYVSVESRNLETSAKMSSSVSVETVETVESQSSSLFVNCDEESRKVRLSQKVEPLYKRHTKPIQKSKDKPLRSKAKYFTSRQGCDASNARDVLAEPSPFEYPKDLEEFAHQVMTKAWRTERRTKEMKLKYNERHNFKTRQQADIVKRLYVPEPEIKSLKMIKDLDKDFFSIVEGRPVKEKLKLRHYIQCVRDVLKTKILIGYRGDDIMLIDENLILEQKEIDEIRRNLQTYMNTFEEFLYHDHTASMNLLKESDREAQLSQEKYEEFRQLSREYAALRSILYSTEEKWRNCKLYQRFLYLVSPMSWRKEHDYYFQEHEAEQAMIEGTSTIFGKYRLAETEVTQSLEDLIHQFRDDCTTQQEPVLYFEQPSQLLDVFRFMELQNLNSLLHAEELAVPLENVREGMEKAEQLFNAEVTTLQEMIDKLEGGILWEEERARYLEQLAMELINGQFRNLVVAEDVLNLHVFVEDVYETTIGPNDANLGIGEMMKMIECKFREELISLDQLPSEQVTKLEVTCYREEAKMLKAAQRAARDLLEFEMLYGKMQKVFAPPYHKEGRELKWRSPPYNPPKPVPPPPRELTKEEKQYLEFFTEFCKYTDDLADYGIDITRPKEEDTPKGTNTEVTDDEEIGQMTDDEED